MRVKCITSALHYSCVSCSSVYGSEAFDNMSTSEQAQTAGAYIEEIIKDIQNNYYGGNVQQTSGSGAIKGMTGQLDEYSQYIDIDEYNAIKADSASTHYAPDFKCEFNDNGYPIIKEISRNSVAYKQGLREGDEIREISNISAYGIGVDEYQTLVTKNSSSTVSMKIASTGAIKKMDVKLTRVDNSSVEVVAMSKLSGKNQNYDDKTIGYVKVKEFTENVGSEFQQAVVKLQASGAKKLIIDLRGNTWWLCRCSYCYGEANCARMGVIISTKDKQGKETVYKSDLKVRPFEKYVILVDNNTASAAEIVASAMQDSGVAKIVGEKTFGKGIMQSVTAYEGLGVLKMTTQEYTTRLGRIINGIGITPDISIDRLKFVSETDTLDSKNVESAVKFLGYKIDKENTVAKDLGMYQLEMGLPVTYVLDKATVSAINLEIYNDMINNDRALTAGYLSLLS